MHKTKATIDEALLLKAYHLMACSVAMSQVYEENFKLLSRYVHATSRGHEAVQIALGLQLKPQDYAAPYYRDESMLLAIGMRPYELMLQLLAKRDDPFSGGRVYYGHASLRDEDKPKIPYQSPSTGMQAIPATGVAMGIQYKENLGLTEDDGTERPIVVCCFGDGSITEGEVSEAFQMAALKQFPILYLIEDNGWDISANSTETRAQDAAGYAKGFHGIEVRSIEGNNFFECYQVFEELIATIRKERRPFLVHARVPLLTHHTSGVRMEWYRDDLEEHRSRDPYPIFKKQLLEMGLSKLQLNQIEKEAQIKVKADFEAALKAEDPRPEDLFTHDFAPTPVKEEKGIREPEGGSEKLMVDCALFAVEELLRKHPECLFYGQDVGGRLGGVFREAATLAKKFGDERVFNTPIQEAFIIGSSAGVAAVGLKPIVEIQFADYMWPGMNQLFAEVSRSCYLTNGKWPVSTVIRVPTGAYNGGGPFHSTCIESVVCNIRGVKIAFPSNGADLKGLMKAAYYDPNPVVMFEHKGLYWSKLEGTETAKSVLPDEDYIIPFGKSRKLLMAEESSIETGNSIVVVTYGMGVHWALNAAKTFSGQIELIDLRTLVPLDEKAVLDAVKLHHKCLVITEEPANHSFAQALCGRIQDKCFEYLDAPVRALGSEEAIAVPLSYTLERTMIPSIEKVSFAFRELLAY